MKILGCLLYTLIRLIITLFFTFLVISCTGISAPTMNQWDLIGGGFLFWIILFFISFVLTGAIGAGLTGE